jgi:hypothetical protein
VAARPEPRLDRFGRRFLKLLELGFGALQLLGRGVERLSSLALTASSTSRINREIERDGRNGRDRNAPPERPRRDLASFGVNLSQGHQEPRLSILEDALEIGADDHSSSGHGVQLLIRKRQRRRRCGTNRAKQAYRD